MVTLITPDTLAATGTELGLQSAIVHWSKLPANRLQWPDLEWLHAIPNGGARSASSAANAKREGVKSGIPDMFLPTPRGPWHGLYVEMKRTKYETTKDKGLSEAQNKAISYLKAQGYGVAVCYRWSDARDVIINYLNWDACK